GWGIFTINIDGSNPRKVAPGGWPAWSPDGKQIAYSGKADYGDATGQMRIFVINVDGTQKRQVSTGEGTHECPAWAADGRGIAYQALVRDQTSGKSNTLVRVVNADGSGDVVIGTPTSYHNEMPSWFPDGERLAIQSDREGAMAIYIVDLSGKTLARVAPPFQETKPRGYYVNPDWSPDGSKIAYSRDVEQKSGIYIYDTKTGEERLLVGESAHQAPSTPTPTAQPKITRPVTNGGTPVVSADGSRIAFISNRAGNDHLFVISADGTGETQ